MYLPPRLRILPALALVWAIAAPAAAHVWRFEANLGQTDPQAQFVARGPGYRAYFTAEGAVLDLGGGNGRSVLRVGPADGLARVAAGEAPGSTAISYLALGGSTGARRVSAYDRVRYRSAFPGADLVFYGRDGQLEFDVELEPGAEVASVRLRIEGAQDLALDAEGGLRAGTTGEPLRFLAPVAYQLGSGGERLAVSSRFLLDSARGEIGFEVGEYDRARALVIDPVLVFSTFLGGEGSAVGHEQVYDVAVDAAGNVYAVGATVSLDFPVVGAGGCDDELNDGTNHSSCDGTPWTDQLDAFVTKLAPDGVTALYSTYLGGDLSEVAKAVAVNAAGEAYVVGMQYIEGIGTWSQQGFVVRLRADGSGALFTQTFGDSLFADSAEDVAIDAAGNVFVAGYVSEEAGFPAGLPGIDHDFEDLMDGFVLKYTQTPTTNSLAAWTYVGGAWAQDIATIAVGTDGSLVAVGRNFDTDFTDGNVFVLRLNSTLTGVAGGPTTITGTAGRETPYDVVVDPSNRVWIAGDTTSADLCAATPPLPGLDTVFNAPSDGFAFRLTANLAASDYCTFVGGNGCDWVHGMALDGNLLAFVGTTIPGGGTCGFGERGAANAFLVGVQESPPALRFSYQFGGAPGASSDEAKAVVRAADGTFVLGGRAGGASFPTTPGAFEEEYPASAGFETGFVMRVDPVTRLSIFDRSASEGSGGGTTAFEFELSLNGWPLDNVSYTLNTANGTASSPGDFVARSGVCANCFTPFGPGYRVETVQVVADGTVEANETFQVNLSAPFNAVLADGSATGTIVNDDVAAGSIQWQAAAFSANESAGTFQLVITRTGGTAAGASAQYAVTGGSATGGGTDYTLAAGTVTFAANQTTRNVPLTIVNDTLDEANETLVVTLSAPGGGAALGSPAVTTVTLLDDDTAGTIQFSSATTGTGEGAGSSVISVARSGGAASGVTVSYAVTGGTATGGGVDYTLASGVLTFGANDNLETMAASIVDDLLDESSETVVVTLSNPTGGAVLGATVTHTMTIADNDDPPPSAGSIRFSAATLGVTEGSEPSACLTLQRVGGSSGAIGFHLAAVSGTATLGEDFFSTHLDLGWADGDATNQVACVILRDDTTDEPAESFNVELSNPTGGATLGSPSVATVTIADDDPAGQLFRDGFESGNTSRWSTTAP
jgi:hypothetical protein